MKKVFVVFSVLLLMGFAFDIQANDFFEWAVGDTIGPKGESAQFCAVDHEGKLWITDYGTPGHVGLYVFNSDGSQAPFSPITAGLDENGNTFNIANAGGVAYYDSVTYAISDNPGAVLRFKASDGTPLNGWAVSYRTGDIDVDTAGHVFVGHKVEAMFSVYDVAGTELTGSPFGVAGWHLNRGLSVTQDGSKIFLADESSDVIAMYTGSISGDVADYTKGSDFMTGLNNPSACEIDPNGRMWISNTGNNELIITELDGTILQTIPDVATPRGAAFDFDNNLAYVAHFTSATNMAHQLIPIHHPEPEELYTWWEKNAGGYTFFQKDDKTRGMDLNPVTGHLLVASRTGGNFIHIIDAGEYIGTLDMTGVSGGTFVINLVSVADDGVIYGSNLTTSGSGFKVYRWENESVAPTVAFDGNVDQRVGDSFTAIGSGTGTILYASGANGTKIYVFTTTDGISFSLFDEIPISSSLARGGVAPVADTLGSDIWVNCSGKQVALIDTSGTVLVTIGDTLNTFFAHIDYLETSGDRKLIAVAGGNVGDIPRCIRAEIWDVTNPFAPWYYEYGALTNTPNANVNGTGIAILEEKEDGVLNLYHLLGNNGIALYCEEELVVNTPPTAFHLISPEDNATIRFEDLTADTLLEVKWSQSFDIDPLDSVAIYEMIVLDESQATVFDTVYTDTLNYYSPDPSENGTYKWFVLAKDTRGGVTSSDTFTVTFDIQVSIHPEPEELYTWWEKNAGDYTFFQSDDKTRGMDLNPVTGHLIVASRTGGNNIHILEAENGTYLDSLDMTGVSGGTFPINLVSVASDGVIYGCNLTATGAGFKFYRWGDESSTPTVAFEGNLDQRAGDSFTVMGSGANTIVYASGISTKIYVFTTTDGISFSLFDEIPISSSLARGGIAPVADTLGSDIWVNCSGKQVALIDTSGTVLVTIGDTLNTYFAHIDYLETSDDRKLIAVAGGNVGDIPRCIRAEIWDVTNPHAPWYYEYGALTNTPNANVNGTGIAILEEKGDGVLNLYHLLSNNGIALYCEEELVKNTPPTAFHLISPEDNAIIRFEDLAADTLLEVKWSQSFDIDPLDSVAIYEMIVLDESQATVFDTIYTDTLNYSPVPSENGTYKWFVLAKDTRGGVTSSDTFTVTFDIQVSIDEVVGIPETFALYQNYPNPFNPTTFIKYDLPKEAKVKIIIYNLMGEEVRALVNEKQNAGYKSKLWDGRDNNGNMVSSGVYIYRMITDEFQKTNKMIFLK